MRYIYQHYTNLFISPESDKSAFENKTEFNQLIKDFEQSQRKQIINQTKALLENINLEKYVNHSKETLADDLINTISTYISENNTDNPRLPNGLVKLLMRKYLLHYLLTNEADFQIGLHNYFVKSDLPVKTLLANLENAIHNIDKEYIAMHYVPENYFHLDYIGQKIEFNQNLINREIDYIESHSNWKYLKDIKIVKPEF